MSVYQQRIAAFQKTFPPETAVLVSKPTDIFYFTGFPQLAPAEREAFLLIAKKKAVLFHHSFSPVLPQQAQLKTVPKTALSEIVLAISNFPAETVLIDEQTLSVAEYHELKKLFTGTIQPLKPQQIWKLRTVKDHSELLLMRKAGQITAKVMKAIRKELKPGITERAAANRIVSLMLEEGAEGTAFPVIVAFGPNGALPHHQPTEQKLKKETPVLIDFGAQFQGYLSDMTRSFWFGTKPSPSFQHVENIVKTAYQQSVSQLKNRTGTFTAKDADDAARKYIAGQGFGDQFIHTTGHGLGIEIHEPPSLSWQSSTLLLPGMTVTVEPGIYLSGEFGYRYENTLALTARGADTLTQ